MNFFIIPSWYPASSNPTYGIFIKEQVAMMARQRPNWNIGVSTWGQGDPEKLIWVKDHFRNIRKMNKHGYDKAKIIDQKGFREYYQPALSWTKKIIKGNLREIIQCNELNYQAYTLENGKPDFIMVQACYPGILIADYLSKKYNIPVHLHIRLGGFMFESLLADLGSMKADLLNAISRANIITATSDFHRKELAKWVPNSTTLYNPVDTHFFELANKQDDYALSIGRLESEKGFDLLLNAVTKTPYLKLKIVGSGSMENMLRKKIDSLGLIKQVSLLGECDRETVKKLIQKSQFLILPSKYETFGNVLLEAMACGKPVVATKCGGPEEIVHPTSGYLADASIEDLSEKIDQMIKTYPSFNPNEIRAIVQKYFSPTQWITSLERLVTAS